MRVDWLQPTGCPSWLQIEAAWVPASNEIGFQDRSLPPRVVADSLAGKYVSKPDDESGPFDCDRGDEIPRPFDPSPETAWVARFEVQNRQGYSRRAVPSDASKFDWKGHGREADWSETRWPQPVLFFRYPLRMQSALGPGVAGNGVVPARPADWGFP